MPTADNCRYPELDPRVVPPKLVAPYLAANHYLGAIGRGTAWTDEYGVIVLARPTSRRLPSDGTWLGLSRWCLLPGIPNSGSRQWAQVARWIRTHQPDVTTVVSYSDPSVGHTGALCRICVIGDGRQPGTDSARRQAAWIVGW